MFCPFKHCALTGAVTVETVFGSTVYSSDFKAKNGSDALQLPKRCFAVHSILHQHIVVKLKKESRRLASKNEGGLCRVFSKESVEVLPLWFEFQRWFQPFHLFFFGAVPLEQKSQTLRQLQLINHPSFASE